MKTVLLIDDEPDLIEIFCELLSMEDGVVVHTAVTGDEGLEKFKELSPNLVITDESLPGIKGPELIKHFREISGENVKIYLASGNPSLNERQVKEMGGDGLFIKPFEFDSILELLEDC